MLIIDVPNDFNDFQVVANAEYNLNEWWVYPPNHINYFSHDTLANLLIGCGFDSSVHFGISLELFLLFAIDMLGILN